MEKKLLSCSRAELIVYFFLKEHLRSHGKEFGIVEVSFRSLADQVNINRSSVVKSIGKLVDAGFLEMENKGGGRGKRNRYRMVL